MRTRKLSFDCKNCEHSFGGRYFPGSPGTYWEPPEPDELEIPEECPHCCAKLNPDDYIDSAYSQCEPPED